MTCRTFPFPFPHTAGDPAGGTSRGSGKWGSAACGMGRPPPFRRERLFRNGKLRLQPRRRFLRICDGPFGWQKRALQGGKGRFSRRNGCWWNGAGYLADGMGACSSERASRPRGWLLAGRKGPPVWRNGIFPFGKARSAWRNATWKIGKPVSSRRNGRWPDGKPRFSRQDAGLQDGKCLPALRNGRFPFCAIFEPNPQSH